MRTVLYHIERKCLLMEFDRNLKNVYEKIKSCTNGFEAVGLLTYTCVLVETIKRDLFKLDNPNVFKRGGLVHTKDIANVKLCNGERVLTKDDINKLDVIRYAIQNHQQKTTSLP